MIRVLEFFGQDVTKSPEVLAKCFADTTADVVKDANVIGLPTGCYLGAGSEVTTANGTKARLKSDGNWVWLAKADLITRTITENGTYEAADDNADGYVEVTVNVPEPTLVTKSITANGTYDPADDEADGYSEVSVNVAATTYDVQGTLTIDGSNYVETPGSKTDHSPESGDIYTQALFSMSINIPNTAVGINSAAFEGWKGLTSVNIPDSVTEVCNWCFYNCVDLVSVRLSNSLIVISDHCFDGCTSLVSVNIPEGVTTIEGSAFNNCTSLTTVVLPSTTTLVESYAFMGCTALTSITCNAITPPSMNEGIESSKDITLYVPAESISAYESSNWMGLNIQPIPTT